MATGSGQYAFADAQRMMHRDELVMQHLPQVRLIARRIYQRLPSHVSLDDLISTGIVGLLGAIDNFDESLNVQLNTYAERRIHGAIIDSLRDADWAPRDARRKAKTIESAIHKAKQRLGREPSEEEIATELGVKSAQYQEWLSSIQGIDLARLDYATPDQQQGSLLRFISDDEDNWPSNIVERSELERVLTQAIERMSKVERTVLHLYYYEELGLREIAQVVGLHLSRVAQLRVQGILRLRSHLERVWPMQTKRRQ
jgi:RNA polymerase sigma factor FliA